MNRISRNLNEQVAGIRRICAFIFLVGTMAFPNLTFSQPEFVTDPGKAKYVLDDVELFLTVYKGLDENSDTVAILQSDYLDKGSVGLKEYVNKKSLTAEQIMEAMKESPQEYDSISWILGMLKGYNKVYTQMCRKFGELIEGAIYTPTYFLIGANKGIAQASKEGQLVSITIFASPKMLKRLMPTVMHELTHMQQLMNMGVETYLDLYSENRTNDLIGYAIREGVAEFITMQVSGSITQLRTLNYYQEQDQNKLWESFTSDVLNESPKDWLWETIGKENQLIAYVMGYEIAKGYYESADDKKMAIRKLLKAEDNLEIFKQSGLMSN